jgi:CDP-diacylglycerol--glycerol-3-phosphate 3-phosphatidyltransferase
MGAPKTSYQRARRGYAKASGLLRDHNKEVSRAVNDEDDHMKTENMLKTPNMTLANKVTVARIILVPVFIVFTVPDAIWTRFVAASIFVLACATDPLDGYFARSRSEVSVLGTFLDPLADKLLTMSAFIVMVKYQVVAAWMAIIIVGREVTITGLRAIVSQQMGAVIPANRWGKIKTLVQMVGGSILLFMIPSGQYSPEVSLSLPPVANLIMSIILAATVWSGWVYVKECMDYFRNT